MTAMLIKLKSVFFRHGLTVAGAALVLDQLNKWYMLHILQIGRQPIEVTPFFNLVMVWNYGISFGMFSNEHAEYNRYILIAMTSAITGILLVMLTGSKSRFNATAIGLVIGGALGNIIDRMVYGAVADFFDFHIAGYHWPAFNIADSAICIGVVLLCYESIFDTKQQNKEISGE